MSAEQIAKYEEWIRELGARQKSLADGRARYRRIFTGAVALSLLGFFWSFWVGVGTVFTGVLFAIFGFYVIVVRDREYTHELTQTRRALARLRAQAAGDAPHR